MGHQQLYWSHLREFSQSSHSCQVCSNYHDLIWKYGLNMCQHCFCQYDDIGFIKLDQVNFLEWIIQHISCSVTFHSLRPHGLQPARLLCLWDSPGKNTRVGFHFFLQGIFLTQGSNPGLLHCRQVLYSLSYHRSSSIQKAALNLSSRSRLGHSH